MGRKNGQRGKTLKARREAAGVHQAAVADWLGVPRTYLSFIENEIGGYGVPRGFAADHASAIAAITSGGVTDDPARNN